MRRGCGDAGTGGRVGPEPAGHLALPEAWRVRHLLPDCVRYLSCSPDVLGGKCDSEIESTGMLFGLHHDPAIGSDLAYLEEANER
jgi:hypothetical protein